MLLLSARPRDLGGFTVRRTLPAPQRRLVGPFIFWDHMGPAELAPGEGLDVRPHPHVALATVTYLFDGEIVHKDSLGSDQSIRPGAVNWMTAGRGIVHSERTGPELRRHGSSVHGIQSWVALPKALEDSPPSFQHHAAASIPELGRTGIRMRVVAGDAYGVTSPVRVSSALFYVEARLEPGAELEWPEGYPERAAYVVEGAVSCDGEPFEPGTMRVADPGEGAPVCATTAARVLFFGGAPLDGERHIWWNFVSSSRERIEQAKIDWKEERFPRVPGDEVERIPLPEDDAQKR